MLCTLSLALDPSSTFLFGANWAGCSSSQSSTAIYTDVALTFDPDDLRPSRMSASMNLHSQSTLMKLNRSRPDQQVCELFDALLRIYTVLLMLCAVKEAQARPCPVQRGT